MVSLRRPRVVRYLLRAGTDRRGKPVYTSAGPDGRPVTKTTPGAEKVTETTSIWWGSWRLPGGRQHKLVSLHTSDRETAEQIVRERERNALLEGEGLRPANQNERQKPLAEHLDDFIRHLAAKGDVPRYVAEVRQHVLTVYEGCRFARAADVDPDAVHEFLADLRAPADLLVVDREVYTVAQAAAIAGVQAASVRLAIRRGRLVAAGSGPAAVIGRDALAAWLALRARGVSVETSNHYLRSCKSFARWLRRRVGSDPLQDLQALNPETDRRRVRRALSQTQVPQLLAAAAAGPVLLGLCGPSRRLLYHAAARTGLRAGELASLTPRSLTLGPRPAVTVQAGYSKHRRQDVLPLRAELAAELQAYCAGRAPGEPLWPGSWSGGPAQLLRPDLVAAGIPERDELGRVVDFHALRHTFITHLIETGVPPKTAQMLARHSTITLTMDRYCGSMNVMDAAADLERLPAVGVAPALPAEPTRGDL